MRSDTYSVHAESEENASIGAPEEPQTEEPQTIAYRMTVASRVGLPRDK